MESGIGIDIDEGDGRTGDDGPRGIEHLAIDGSAIALCEQRADGDDERGDSKAAKRRMLHRDHLKVQRQSRDTVMERQWERERGFRDELIRLIAV